MHPSDCDTHSGTSMLGYPFSPGIPTQHPPSDVIGRTGTQGEQEMYVGVNEERLLLRSTTIKPKRLNLKGVLKTFFVVVGIYVLSMGAGKYIIRSYFGGQSSESFIKLPPKAQKDVRCQADASCFQTCWEDCAGSYLPVLGGIDVVAYQAIDPGETPVYGNQWHEALYGGYRFWFVSEANKALFQDLPAQYTPEWGGFCSWGISRQQFLSTRDLDPRISPTSWLVTDEGKLHLFRSEEAKTAFQDNLIETLMNGNKVWNAWWGEGAVPGAEMAGGSPLNTGCICEADSCLDA